MDIYNQWCETYESCLMLSIYNK